MRRCVWFLTCSMLLTSTASWAGDDLRVDQSEDPALGVRTRFLHHPSKAIEQEGSKLIPNLYSWFFSPDVEETYDRSRRWMALRIEVHGDSNLLGAGAAGLICTVDGSRFSFTAEQVLESAKPWTHSEFTHEYTVKWVLADDSEKIASMLRAIASGKQVYFVFPSSPSGVRFTVLLTEKQLAQIREMVRLYES